MHIKIWMVKFNPTLHAQFQQVVALPCPNHAETSAWVRRDCHLTHQTQMQLPYLWSSAGAQADPVLNKKVLHQNCLNTKGHWSQTWSVKKNWIPKTKDQRPLTKNTEVLTAPPNVLIMACCVVAQFFLVTCYVLLVWVFGLGSVVLLSILVGCLLHQQWRHWQWRGPQQKRTCGNQRRKLWRKPWRRLEQGPGKDRRFLYMEGSAPRNKLMEPAFQGKSKQPFSEPNWLLGKANSQHAMKLSVVQSLWIKGKSWAPWCHKKTSKSLLKMQGPLLGQQKLARTSMKQQKKGA